MLKMRLQRTGRKNDPSFRVVVTDSRNGPRAGNPTDTIGFYSPRQGEFRIDADKAKFWLSKGVQPSDTIYNFLISKGVIEGKKRNVLPKKTPIVKEVEEPGSSPETPKEEASEGVEKDAPATEDAQKPQETTENTKTEEVTEEGKKETEKKPEEPLPEGANTGEEEEKESPVEKSAEEKQPAELPDDTEEAPDSETDAGETKEEKQN